MGYEIHIVRQTDYEDGEEESNISLEEWLAYVKTDEELELIDGYQVNIPEDQPAWQKASGFCEWMGHPRSDADTIPWFDYGHGCISTKYPDEHTIKKMIRIAHSLNARVRGDDFEYYDETYNANGANPIPDQNTLTDTRQSGESTNTQKPWWKFW